MTTLFDDMNRVGATIEHALARVREEMADLDAKRELLRDALMSVDEAWSGSNLGYHADLYFGDFARPSLGRRFDPEWGGMNGLSEGWDDRDLAEVQSAIEQRAGVSIDDYANEGTRLATKVREPSPRLRSSPLRSVR